MKIFSVDTLSIAPGFNSGYYGNSRFKADEQFDNKVSVFYRPKNDLFEQNSYENNNDRIVKIGYKDLITSLIFFNFLLLNYE